MFLFDSLPPFRTTEPTIFNILRLLSAIIFSIALVCFAWISFDNFVSNFYKPGLYISEAVVNDYLGYYEGFTYPEFKICPKTLSDYNDDSLNIAIYKLYYDTSNFQTYIHNEYSFLDYINRYESKDNFHSFNRSIAYKLSIPNNAEFITPEDHCRIFKPSSLIKDNVVQEFAGSLTLDNDSNDWNNELLFIITFNNLTIYDHFEIYFESVVKFKLSPVLNSKSENFGNAKIASNQYFLTGGQFVAYEFSIKERKSYSSYFSGMLGFKADKNETIIEIEETVLFPIPNASYTVLELTFSNDFITYEEEKYETTVIGLISRLGGFYSAVSSIFVLLFGTSKLSPWEVCQKWVCCWSYHRSFEKELASRYVSCAGIPFAEDPCRLRPDARIENRIAALENLLKEYYIDANYLEKLRTTRGRYLDLQNLFDESERLLEDSNA